MEMLKEEFTSNFIGPYVMDRSLHKSFAFKYPFNINLFNGETIF